MLKLRKIQGTCSMLELVNVDKPSYKYSEISEFTIKSGLLNYLWRNGEEYPEKSEPLTKSIKTIIYNTNYMWFERLLLWWRFGFKTKHSYKGNSGRVYVMFLKIN